MIEVVVTTGAIRRIRMETFWVRLTQVFLVNSQSMSVIQLQPCVKLCLEEFGVPSLSIVVKEIIHLKN